MRKIILGVAVTLDGFIEGPNGEYDWCLTDHDYGMDELWLAVHPLLLGSGKSLVSHLPGRVAVQLVDTKTYNTGLVSLTYKISP